METGKARMIVNASGGKRGGSSTFRATLPTGWVRKMGLGEDTRDLRLEFDGERIIITNNEEEVKMLNNMLEKAIVEIEKEMKEMGFIDDSDNQERYLDELSKKLIHLEILKGNEDIELYYEKEDQIEEMSEELLEEIEVYMKKTYKREGSCNDRGDYTGCYCQDKEGLKNWSDSFEQKDF